MRGRRSGEPKRAAHNLRRTITRLVRNLYPGCHPQFIGNQSLAAPRSRQFGFRIIGEDGIPRSGIIRLDPAFYHRCNKRWLESAVRRNTALEQLLAERSKETARISLDEVRELLRRS